MSAGHMDAYEQALRAYLDGAAEEALHRAYLLGRELLEHRLGLLHLIHLHHEALDRVRADRDDPDLGQQAAVLLSEAAAPFEMAQRGFQEANKSLRELSADLQRQVREKTGDLEASLAELAQVGQERRQLLAHLVHAQEEERRRIAGDIHDDSIQVVTALAMRLSVLSSQSEGPAREAADKAAATAQEATRRLRGLIFDLRPPALEQSGLIAALEELRQRWSQEWGFACRIEPSLRAEPPMAVRVVLFRIAQEALTNAWKHARADTVRVAVSSDGDAVLLRVEDDGDGFDVHRREGARLGHLGMVSMRERAEMAGGTFLVRSSPGQGTKIRVRIPLFTSTQAPVPNEGEGPDEDVGPQARPADERLAPASSRRGAP